MRFAFVVPRYVRGIAGGAEALCGAIAAELAKRGEQIEILTTCAVDNRTWENALPEGIEDIDGITVRRFLVGSRDLDTWIPLQIRLHEGFPLTTEEELDWFQESVTSPDLFAWIQEKGGEYDKMFFAPYLFGTTFWGALIHKERSVLIPCFHDEPYAYLRVMKTLVTQVRGCLFNARGEQDFARRLYGPTDGGVVGMGFPVPAIDQVEIIAPLVTYPYVLYLGRKETGKNVQVLIDDFIALKEIFPQLCEVKLLIAGGGDVADLHRPEAFLRDDILDMGKVSEEEKQQLLRFAICLIQPSVNESFSIVLMEAWQVETPCVVPAACAVTKTHIVDSGGGLYYSHAKDLGGIILTLMRDEDLGRTLGRAGREYVIEKYSWDAVMERFYEQVGLLGT